MKKLILLLLFICSSQLFSQDYLTTISGKEYEGQYIGFMDGKVQFIQKGATVPTDIPSSSVNNVKLANGKTLSFGSELLMNDGTNFKGSWIMTSKDIIRFLVSGEKKYTDFDRTVVKSIIYPDGKSIDLEKITDYLYLETTVNQKDILIFGRVDDSEVEDDKVEDKFNRRSKKVGNQLWIYGKYLGVDFQTGEIKFRGNDGKIYSDPTNVVKIKFDNNSIDKESMMRLRERAKYSLSEQLKANCNLNKEIKVMVLPFMNDFFGLTEDVQDEMKKACYTIISNQDGLKYLRENKIKKDEIDDYVITLMGKTLKVDYILYGFANNYNVPFKYAPTSSDPMAIIAPLVSDYYWFDAIFTSIGRWSVYNAQTIERSMAVSNAGSYVGLTYYSINPNTGEKLYLLKNGTVLKIG